ncbi:CHASE2 domain-containing protein [Argonema galeatum]|uniref:CHASE2 domain-containing protein n=1 Tax=Argonema galeatum TaxID=2942762 RepID=UPI002011BBAA|nr:adenylate/guanylate cyclase domain-containing protein [Argonema galeatum]MCL1468464.1 adenylate/guanylate cyclase domain-containing protein [Argonema galeatum A003/A1]
MRAKLKRKIWEWRSVLLTAPTVTGLIIILRLTGLLQSLEWAALDQFYRRRPPEAIDDRIVIVGIDESDLKKIGSWPISDEILAKLLLKIKAQQPRAIALDLYRDLPVEPGHQALVKVFESTPNLIGIKKVVGNERGVAISPSPVLSRLGRVAANDVVLDSDGKIRRGILFLTPENQNPITSLGLRMAMIYLQAEGITPQSAQNGFLRLGKTVFVPFEASDGSYVGADAGGYQVLLNFRGRGDNFPTVSMTDILENRIPADLMRDRAGAPLRDRIVLIGPTAASLNDFFYTPYSGGLSDAVQRMTGVEIHAHLTSQILSSAIEGRSPIKTWPDPLEYGWIFLWSWVGAVLSWQLQSWRWTAFSALVAISALLGGSFLAFLNSWWIPVIPPILSFSGSAVAILAYIAQIERQDRKTVMNLFGRHVNPQIAEAIWRDRDQFLNDGRLKGQRLTATVVFTDLKDFSTIAENLDPEVLMSWLNEYMEAMSQLVLANSGVVDKFIGDAVMAVFGVPIPSTTEDAIANDAKAAVRCALQMGATLELLNELWKTQGRPTVAMRVGIATGTVVTGSLGSSQRLDYTTIGDSVNVAARLESYDKSLDGGLCRILINEETYQYIHGSFPTKLIGSVQLKGREQLTPIYQVLLE